MGKLIELLNEWYLERYGTNPHFVRFEDYGGNDYGYFHSYNDGNLMVETEVWTKKYGFIKWLVEKNKIDIERLHKIVDYRLEIKENYLNAHDYNSDCLLMLLAISDTPINDLISYLK